MARNRTLEELLFDLRAECRMSTDSIVGQSSNPALKVLLRRTQEILYDKWDWPHLDGVWFDKTLSAGQRYYDFPSGLNYERATTASVLFGGLWTPLGHGFGTAQYNQYNSDNDERSDPVLKWRIYSGSQFEVWPIPAVAGTIRFTGSQGLGSFDQDSDVCVLDGTMIVLFAAAEVLADKPRGKVLLAQAGDRFETMKARSQNASGAFRPGSAHIDSRRPREIVVRVK